MLSDIDYINEANANLTYDPDTGIFRSKFTGKPINWNRRGYVVVRLFGRLYMAHRVAWLMTYGEWPKQQIDHINHDKTDNRIANLRDISQAGNNLNRLPSKRNTSGFAGVRHCGGKWEACSSLNDKNTYLGRYQTKEEAISAYNKFNEKRFGV